MSQTEQIRSHLEEHGKIDPMTALKIFGCMRLAARISDLKEGGVKISTEMKSENGRRWAVYHLDKDQSGGLVYDDRFIHDRPRFAGDPAPKMPAAGEELKTGTSYVVSIPALIGRLVLAGVQVPSTVKYYSYSRGTDVPFEYWDSKDMVDDTAVLCGMLNSISPDGCWFGWNDDERLGWWPLT